jgi:hypothetical protein
MLLSSESFYGGIFFFSNQKMTETVISRESETSSSSGAGFGLDALLEEILRISDGADWIHVIDGSNMNAVRLVEPLANRHHAVVRVFRFPSTTRLDEVPPARYLDVVVDASEYVKVKVDEATKVCRIKVDDGYVDKTEKACEVDDAVFLMIGLGLSVRLSDKPTRVLCWTRDWHVPDVLLHLSEEDHPRPFPVHWRSSDRSVSATTVMDSVTLLSGSLELKRLLSPSEKENLTSTEDVGRISRVIIPEKLAILVPISEFIKTQTTTLVQSSSDLLERVTHLWPIWETIFKASHALKDVKKRAQLEKRLLADGKSWQSQGHIWSLKATSFFKCLEQLCKIKLNRRFLLAREAEVRSEGEVSRAFTTSPKKSESFSDNVNTQVFVPYSGMSHHHYGDGHAFYAPLSYYGYRATPFFMYDDPLLQSYHIQTLTDTMQRRVKPLPST